MFKNYRFCVAQSDNIPASSLTVVDVKALSKGAFIFEENVFFLNFETR